MYKKLVMGAMLCGIELAAIAREVTLDLAGTSGAGKPRTLAAASANPEEVRSHRLEPGAARVSGLVVGDVITFKLFSDKELAVTLVEETASLSGRAFLGRIDNALNALACVVLETEAGLVLDVTDFERRRVWQVVSDDRGVAVREMEPSLDKRCGSDTLLPPCGLSSVNVAVETQGAGATVTTNAPSLSSQPRLAAETVAAGAVAGEGDKPTVDILVNYDTDAAAWARANGGGLETFAETCVQKMNAALANTGLAGYFTFKLVGVYEVGGSAGGDLTSAVYFASGYYSGTLNGVSWAGVREERDRVSADIVCTLCDNGSAYGTVGLGYSAMSGSDFASCGFNACQIRSVATSHTMTHEVGHNMGAGHSDKMADASNCGPQYYDYSSGYYFYVGSTGYYTIMAYNADGYGNYYTSVPYFSSPDYYYLGVAVGTARNDNTRTLRLNYQSVVDNRRPPFVSTGIGEGFEAEEYVWLTDGMYPWSRVTDVKTDGVDSSRSCEMSGNTTSWAETKVRGPATLTFKVRLRTYGGRFNVLTDGIASYSYGGSSTQLNGNTWNSASVDIPAGEHTVRLAYTHPGQGYAIGGNGAWVDQLSFAGGTPVRDEPTETETTPVPVPYTWLASYYPTASTSDYEQIASQKGANGYFVWESYVAGLDPTDALSVFRVLIDMVDGQPVLSYEPVLSAEETAKRLYTTYGRTSLETEPWQKVSPGREGDYKFFKMTVELR